MLRFLVAALLLVNAGFYGWSQGWLDPFVGVPAHGDREPGRLGQQVEPERVRVLATNTRTPAPSRATSPDTSTACMEIGPFSPSQQASAEAAVQAALPQNRIDNVKHETPAVWIVFMGPYAEGDVRQKKVDELRRLRVPFEDIRQVPELGDGLSFGRFDNRNAAERAVAELHAKGVRTARVAQYSPAIVTHTLRLPDLPTAQQTQLATLQSPALAGKSFAPCPR